MILRLVSDYLKLTPALLHSVSHTESLQVRIVKYQDSKTWTRQ